MTDPAQTPSEAFQAGMDARGNGDLATSCPYPEGSGEGKAWLEGWHAPDLAEPDELGFA